MSGIKDGQAGPGGDVGENEPHKVTGWGPRVQMTLVLLMDLYHLVPDKLHRL